MVDNERYDYNIPQWLVDRYGATTDSLSYEYLLWGAETPDKGNIIKGSCHVFDDGRIHIALDKDARLRFIRWLQEYDENSTAE